MRREADRILELIINSSLALGRTSGRLDLAEDDAGRQVVRKIQPINDLSLYLSGVSADERLIGPLRQLMGEESVVMEEKLNYKEPLSEPVAGVAASRADSHFPVHSDWAHYKAQNYPQSIISSAVTIDPCVPETGPLRVWPGSHARHLEHERLPSGDIQVRADLIDLQGGEEVLAPAGSVMLFHALLVHNSVANTSNLPRRLMIYSHFPQSAGISFDARNGPPPAHRIALRVGVRRTPAGWHSRGAVPGSGVMPEPGKGQADRRTPLSHCTTSLAPLARKE